MIEGYVEFEFDLPGALLARLVQTFDSLKPAPLTPENLAALPEEQGVYQLFLKSGGVPNLVYIGKTDGEAGLKVRLVRHAGKILNRVSLNPADIMFKAVRVFVFTAIDLETQLIRHYGGTNKVSWNGSGFGSNDPGKERDTTTYKADHFDALYPIDIDRPLDFELPEKAPAEEVLRRLKDKLPYLIRFQGAGGKSRVSHPDLVTTEIALDLTPPISPAAVLRQLVNQLPPGWHSTKLPSHVIIYKDDTRKFPSGTLIALSK